MKSGMTLRAHVLRCALYLVAAALSLAPAASANETLTYSYDALGRLVKVAHGGTVNSSTSSCYVYDRADNRSTVVVSTTGDCTSPTPVSFSVSDVSVKEGGNLVFTVTRTGTASGTLTVNYATSDETAVAGIDYTAKSGVLTFLSTDSSKTVSVTTADDLAIENDETLLLNLSNASPGSAIGDGQGIGTIDDNDTDCAGVTFTIASNGAVTEGANSVFTVTKSGTSSFSCSISYATSNGVAAAGTDYTAASGVLTFTSAQTSKTVSVATADDAAPEGSEDFSMGLSAPDKGGTIGASGTATATINDNDQCTGISFTIANSGAVPEGTNSTFTVTKTGSAFAVCAVNYATANGTAVAPGDYTATSGTLTFSSTQTSQSISVPTIADALSEGSETFTMGLSAPSNGGVLGSPSSATATITNTGSGVCGSVSFAVSDASAVEGNPLLFTVTKTGSTSSSCSISYATADGTATAPTHYDAKSGTLTFTSAQSSQTVSVTTSDTGRPKGALKMYLNLSGATGGAAISDSQGIGSITASGSGCLTCLQSADPGTTDTPPDAPPPPADTTTTTDPPPTGG